MGIQRVGCPLDAVKGKGDAEFVARLLKGELRGLELLERPEL